MNAKRIDRGLVIVMAGGIVLMILLGLAGHLDYTDCVTGVYCG